MRKALFPLPSQLNNGRTRMGHFWAEIADELRGDLWWLYVMHAVVAAAAVVAIAVYPL